MHTTRRALMGGAAAGLAFAASGCATTPGASGQSVNAVLDRIAAGLLRESPETCTTLGVTEAQAGGRYMDRLDDGSPAGKARLRAVWQEGVNALQRIDRASLSPQDAVSRDVVLTAMENNLASSFSYGSGPTQPYVTSTIYGGFFRMPDFLDSQHQITNRDSADAYLARLAGYVRVLDDENAQIAADAAAGVIPPDFAIDAVLPQLRAFAQTAPAQTVLVTSIARKLNDVAEVSAADKAAMTQRAETIVRDHVFPAYQRQIEALTAVRARATHDAGCWKLPRGDEYYTAALRYHTTTAMTADEIHDTGFELVRSLQGQSDGILRAQGLTEGTVPQRAQQLTQRPENLYENSDAGRERLLSDLNRIAADINARMPEMFGTLARARLEIRRIPTYIEAGSPGGYYQGAALDGSRPGVYYINLANMANRSRAGLRSLTYHEGVPGHHWQVSIQQEAQAIPFIRSAMLGFNAFQEGWGLYAEQLADEMGVYADDPVSRLGYLQSATFRAARLVVDTGMHHKRWTREQAAEFMTGAVGGPAIVELNRYSVWPGQACGYMVGRLFITRIRDDARRSLGARFDIKGFHDTLLTNGATPLNVTEQLVQQWVQRTAGF